MLVDQNRFIIAYMYNIISDRFPSQRVGFRGRFQLSRIHSLSSKHGSLLLLLLLRRLSSLLLQLLDRLFGVALVSTIGLDLQCNSLALVLLSRLNTRCAPPKRTQHRNELTALSLSLARPSCHFPLPSFCSLSCCCFSFSASSGLRESEKGFVSRSST